MLWTQRKKKIFRPKSFWVWSLERERLVWEGKKTNSVERDREEMREIHVDPIYRQIHSSMEREVSRIKMWQKELLRSYREVSTTNRPRWIEKLSRRQKLSRWIKKLSRSYRDKFSKTLMDWNWDSSWQERKIKSSIDSLAVKRYWEAVKIT